MSVPSVAAAMVADRAVEVEGKLGRVRAWLEASDLDALLLGSQANFAWITAGGRSHVSIGEEVGVASAVVTRDRAYVLTANIELRRLTEEEIDGLGFETVDHPWHTGPRDAVAHLVDPSRAVSDLGVAGLRTADPAFAEARRVLMPAEIQRYRALGRDAAEALEAAARDAEPGDGELDVAARLAFECQQRDILPLVNLVAADERIARYRHPIPTTTRIRRALLVALTGRRHGLHASLTRMVSFGKPDEQLAGRHAAAARVDAAMIAASRPGTSLGAILDVAIDRYAREGFRGEWELHHQGGLTGYSGREVFATPGEPYRLRPDQAVAWNPSITRAKSEDTVLITGDGHEVLTRGSWPAVAVGADVERPGLLIRSG